jgi:protein FAM50
VLEHGNLEVSLKESTVGLVQLEDFQRIRAQLQEEKDRQAAKTNDLLYESSSIYQSSVTDMLLEMRRKRRRRKSERSRLSLLIWDMKEKMGRWRRRWRRRRRWLKRSKLNGKRHALV